MNPDYTQQPFVRVKETSVVFPVKSLCWEDGNISIATQSRWYSLEEVELITHPQKEEKVPPHAHCKCMEKDCMNVHFATCIICNPELNKPQEKPKKIKRLRFETDKVSWGEYFLSNKINEVIDHINNQEK